MRDTVVNFPTYQGYPQLDFLMKAGEALTRGDNFFRELLDVLPAAIYVTDAAGIMTYYNEAAATLWGWRPELGTSEWCGSWKLFWPDGRPMQHDECPMAIAVKQGRQVHDMEAIAERPDGVRVPFMPFPTPLYDASGRLVGAVNLLVDITDRKRAEEAAQQLASIVESSDDAIISKDLNGIITSWNKGAERLFGYSAEEAVGKPVTILIPPDRLDEEPGILQRIRRGERLRHYDTLRRRKDGILVNISLTVSPVKNAQGTVIGASKIARDISERKRAQEQERLLAGEMKHRIKNSLATVQALATQTLHTASTEEKQAFIARLHALANAHDLLTVESWDRVPLRSVVARALEAFREGQRERVVTEGSDGIWLSATRALLVAIALHELATNAVKYGALSNGHGRVRVLWEFDAQANKVKLFWRENGGPSVTPPEREGFGSRLIQGAMEGALGRAQLDFDPKGLACTLEVAL
jgi:two-component system CheB/CheR fusion protein